MGQNSRFLQPKQRCVSHPFLLSVLFFFWKCWSTFSLSSVSSQCRGILFMLHTSCERRRKKIHYLGLRLSEQVCWSSSTVALKRKTRAYVIIMNAALLLSGVRDGVVSAGVPSMLGVWDRVWWRIPRSSVFPLARSSMTTLVSKAWPGDTRFASVPFKRSHGVHFVRRTGCAEVERWLLCEGIWFGGCTGCFCEECTMYLWQMRTEGWRLQQKN